MRLKILFGVLAVGIIVLGVMGYAVLRSKQVSLGSNNAAIVVGALVFKSFGGRIGAVVPCISPLGPSLWVHLAIPASPLLPPFSFIWTPPGAITNILPSPTGPAILPFHPGQEIEGQFDVPFVCFTPTVPPIPLPGWRITHYQASLI